MNISFLLFVNCMSGGGLGQSVINALLPRSDIIIVRLPDEAYSWKNIDYYSLHSPGLKVVVCGGDGTINWVVSMLSDYYGNEDDHYRPPLAVIPLGTGNDMSNMLGWGTGFDVFDLAEIDDILNEVKTAKNWKNLDVWDVKTKRLDTDEKIKSRVMLNYFSIGVDANIAKDFASARETFPQLFFCQIASRLMYVPVTFGSLIGQSPLDEYLTGTMTLDDERNVSLSFLDSSKTFIVQAITSIYGGTDLWTRNCSRAVDDGKFEVIQQGGFWSLGLSQIGINLSDEIEQAKRVVLKTSQSAVFQIDGEAITADGPTKFIVERTGSYPMLFAY